MFRDFKAKRSNILYNLAKIRKTNDQKKTMPKVSVNKNESISKEAKEN